MKKKILIMVTIVASLSLSGCVSRNFEKEETGQENKRPIDVIDDAKGTVKDTNENIDKTNENIESLEGN